MLKFPISLSDPVGRGVQNQVKTRARLKLKSLVLYAGVMSPLTPFAGFNGSGFQHYRSRSLYTCGCPAADICVNAIAHMTQAMHRPCLAYLVYMALTIGDKVDFDVTGISDHIPVSISA